MYFRLLLFFSVVCLVACKRKDYFPETQLVAHAGAGLDYAGSPYHDNSLKAIEYSCAIPQLAGIEIDVQPSKEMELWLYHDDDLSSDTKQKGCVSEYRSEEMDKFTYSGIQSEALISLQTALSPLALSGKKVFIDLRNHNPCKNESYSLDSILNVLNATLNQHKIEEKIVVLNTLAWVNPFHQAGYKVFLQLYKGSDWKSLAYLNSSLGFCVPNDEITEEEVKEIHQANRQMIIFDVRSPLGVRRGLKKHPDYLMVDDTKVALSEKYK